METKQKKTSRPAAQSAGRRQVNKPAAKKREEQPRVTPDVVYLAPKPFSRNRLVLRLCTVAAVVVALVLGMSVFFKVDSFRISGAQMYTPYEIEQACGVRKGDNLLLLNRVEAGGKIVAALPYIKTARVGIKLPGTVHIEVEELDVTYGMKDQNEQWWLVSSAGTVLEKMPQDSIRSYGKVLGIHLNNPQPGKKAVAQETGGTQTDENGNTVPVVITGADRLNTALDILEFLEENGVVGQVASVDVNNMGDIQIWYEDIFQVKLGDNKDLGTKISMMMATIRSLQQDKPYERGVLNIANPKDIYYDSFE